MKYSAGVTEPASETSIDRTKTTVMCSDAGGIMESTSYRWSSLASETSVETLIKIAYIDV